MILACNCNNHATRCTFDRALFIASGNVSGGVCQDCQHNTEGKNCESCRPFFFKRRGVSMDDVNVCEGKGFIIRIRSSNCIS